MARFTALALLFAVASAKPLAKMPTSSKALAVRGGGAIGPLDVGLATDISKVVASVTIGSALLEKYGGMAETNVASACKGELFTTNAVIALITGGCSLGLCAGGFDAAKVMAGMWIASLLLTLKDEGVSPKTITDNIPLSVIAVATGFMAFVE